MPKGNLVAIIKMLKEVKRQELLYAKLTLDDQHKQALFHWNKAKEIWEKLAELGWRPTRGCIDWHGEE